MDFSEWEPIYRRILADFGFSREEDERAAELLSGILGNTPDQTEALRARIEGRHVLVCGDAPTLEEEIRKEMANADITSRTIIAADGAASKLLNNGILPDIIVTDLDGTIGDIIHASRLGALVVVHAHGDNIPQIREIAPQLTNVLGTTQSSPLENVHNFGGFTDGDRCCFLAKAFGAKNISLVGFQYDDPDVSDTKKRKLKWAKHLIETYI